MDSPLSSSDGALQPRYRRLFTFGDVLDESIQLFRQRWVSYALISAVALIPPGLVLIWASAAGVITRSISLAELQSGGRLTQASSLAEQSVAIVVTSLVSALFDLVWAAGIVAATDAYLRGQQPGVLQVYTRAIGRLPVLILASLLYLIGLVASSTVGAVLFVVTGFGVGGSIVALVTLLVWWRRRGARKRWVKWLIILTTPFGLPVYVSIRWAMLVPAAVLEGRGPGDALRRSSQLVEGHWLRVASILTVGSLIVGVLLYAPAALIDIPLTISDAARGQFGLNPAEAAVSNAVSVVMQILFASVGTIIYTLTFVDLRNRREGTDIGERLSQLEASAVFANG